jgi:hypothetical protein
MRVETNIQLVEMYPDYIGTHFFCLTKNVLRAIGLHEKSVSLRECIVYRQGEQVSGKFGRSVTGVLASRCLHLGNVSHVSLLV